MSPSDEEDLLFRIDPVCEEFEAALLSGSHPRIESYLEAWREPDRSQLFEALLGIELEHRSRSGLTVEASAYADRFAEYLPRIESRIASLPGHAEAAASLGSGAAFGEYVVVTELGRGGMGVVYEARHRRLERTVALKVLSTHTARDARAHLRFQQEVRAVARLDHPHIVPIFEFGTVEGAPYYTMPVVRGTRLATHVATELNAHPDARLETDTARLTALRARLGAGLIAQAARALAAAHRRGVLHRDVKPSNLLVDSSGKVWVLDFGLAKLEDGDLTMSEEVLGTMRYLPPERFGGRADARGDIYSLGLTLHELLTGRPAYPETDRAKLIHDLMNRRPPPLRSSLPHAPRDLETILLRATATRPEDRFPSAELMAEELERFAQGLPILSRPLPPWERSRRWVARNPIAASLIAAIALIAVGSSIAASVYQRQLATIARSTKIESRLRAEAQANAARMRRSLYRAQMQRAAFESSRTKGGAMTRKLLDAWLPRAGKEDLRGFEWFLMRAQLAEARQEWSLPHLQGVSVEWHPRGHRILGGGKAGVTVWDPTSGEVVVRRQDASHVRASWSPDGRVFASVGSSERLFVHDAESGEVMATLATGPGDVRFAWRPEGESLVVQAGPRISVWAWREQHKPREVSRGDGLGFALSPDGHLLAHRPEAPRLVVTDLRTGKPSHELPRYPYNGCLCFSPDGMRLLAGAYSNESFVFDLRDPANPLVLPRAAEAMTWSADGRLLATSADATIQIWDAQDGRELRTLVGHEARVFDLSFDAHTERLASTSIDTTLRVWSLEAPPGHSLVPAVRWSGNRAPLALGWQPDGMGLVVSCHGERALVDFEAVPAQRKPRSERAPSHWSPDGRHRLWLDPERTVVRHRDGHQVLEAPPTLMPPAWSPDGDTLYLSHEPVIVAHDLERGGQARVGPKGERFFDFSVNADGRRLAARDQEYGISVIDLRGKEVLFRTGRLTPVSQATYPRPQWDPAGTRIAVVFGRHLSIRSGEDGSLLQDFDDHPLAVGPFAWRPDGSRIATACADGVIRLFDPDDGLCASFPGAESVRALTWSPDGARLVALLQSGQLEVWDATAALGVASPR